MIKWFELRNTPPFILNKKHPPSGLRGIFRLWPGGTHSAKERYGASDARFLQYVHPQNLGLSEDFAYLSAALELANTFGTSVVPKKRWSHRMGMGLLRQQGDFCRFEFGGFSWSSHYNSAGMMMVLPILPKTTLFIFLSPPDCNLMENLNFQYKCYPRHLEHRNWGRRLILPETMNCRNCPAYEVLKGGVFFFRKLHGWPTITCQAYGLNETLATAPGCTPDYFAYMSLVEILFFGGMMMWWCGRHGRWL